MDGKVPIGSSANDVLTTGEWIQQYLGKQEPVVRVRIVQWWYRLTAPAESVKDASFIQRELVRRGRIASSMLFFFLLLLLVFALPLGISTANLIVIVVASLLLVVVVIAVLFNRRGKSHITGLLIASAFSMGLGTVILTSPGGLTAGSLSLFDLLVFSELFVASLLPVNWVILAALLNSIFIIVTLTVMPESPDLAYAMHTIAYVILLRPIALHFVVSLVLWLWVRSAGRASQRAERAEVIAAHQHSLAMQEHIVAQQKRALDASIEQIMHIHVLVANGDLSARVPLNEGMLLWPLAIALNNLLSRMQHLQHIEREFVQMLPRFQRGNLAEYELQRAKGELESLLLCVREARQANHCIRALRSGTLLDPLIQEISGQYIFPLPPNACHITRLLSHTENNSTLIVNKSAGGKL